MYTFDHVYIYKTYAGCYEGRPLPGEMIDSAKKYAKQMWGERPTIVSASFQGKLPEWTYLIWASGPVIEDGDGSELVLICYDHIYDPSKENIDKMIASVNWKENAKDWWF